VEQLSEVGVLLQLEEVWEVDAAVPLLAWQISCLLIQVFSVRLIFSFLEMRVPFATQMESLSNLNILQQHDSY
jgi:hypothetical protein